MAVKEDDMERYFEVTCFADLVPLRGLFDTMSSEPFLLVIAREIDGFQETQALMSPLWDEAVWALAWMLSGSRPRMIMVLVKGV